MEKKINSRLYARRGTTAEWLAEDALPLGNGELGYDIEKKEFKIGDGSSKWENLEPFVIDSKLTDLAQEVERKHFLVTANLDFETGTLSDISSTYDEILTACGNGYEPRLAVYIYYENTNMGAVNFTLQGALPITDLPTIQFTSSMSMGPHYSELFVVNVSSDNTWTIEDVKLSLNDRMTSYVDGSDGGSYPSNYAVAKYVEEKISTKADKSYVDDSISTKAEITDIEKLQYYGTTDIEITDSSLFTYRENNDGTLTITEYTGEATDIVIPYEINGKKVAEIQGTFNGDIAKGINDALISILLPNTIIKLDTYAFHNCKNLVNINIPDSVKIISGLMTEWGAFGKCISLTNITIPGSVEAIGACAFYYCTSLKNVSILNGTAAILTDAFEKCTSLESITIPDSVTSIGYGAFKECTSLTNVIIPDSVTSIEDYAFYGCTKLTNITIPNSVTSIGYGAFGYDTDGNVIENVVFYVYPGSAGETYCINNGFKYNLLSIDNETYATKSEVIKAWQPNTDYAVGDIAYTIEYGYIVYNVCTTAHTSGDVIDGNCFMAHAMPLEAQNAYSDGEGRDIIDTYATKSESIIYEEVAIEEESEVFTADRAIADGDGNVISSTYVKQSLFKEDKTSETITLEENTQINCGERTTLNILLPTVVNNGDFFDFVFSVNTTEIAMTIPSDIKFSGSECVNDVFTPSLNKTYHVIISKVGDELWGEVDSRNYIIVEE